MCICIDIVKIIPGHEPLKTKTQAKIRSGKTKKNLFNNKNNILYVIQKQLLNLTQKESTKA